VAISPDGRYVGRGGHQTKSWLIDSETPLVEAGGFTESVAFSPNGAVFISHGNSGQPLRRWAIPSGQELPGGWGGVRTQATFPTGPLAFSLDGSILATLFGVLSKKGDGYLSVVRLWDAETGEEVGRLVPTRDTTPHATRLAFSPDGKLLAGVYGPALIVWDVAKRREVARRQPTKKHIKGLAFTTDGSRLLTASNDAALQVWSAPDWQPTTTYAWKVGKFGCVAVSGDGALAAAGGSTGKVVVWDLD
jgi:WD40 repeat protein